MFSRWLRSSRVGWIIGLLAFFVLRPAAHHLLQLGLEWRAERVWEQSKPRLAQDLRTLDPVLHALEQYRIDHAPKAGPFVANYPGSLQELVPRYLKALPALPLTLRKLEYITISDPHGFLPPLPPGSGLADLHVPRSCEITIPLRPRSIWRQFLGTEPRGTLVYRGVNWIPLPGQVKPPLIGRPAERLAGWDYYPSRRVPRQTALNAAVSQQQEKLKLHRQTRLKALQPLADALDRYWKDHVERPDHPQPHPESLQALVPGYLHSLPKLPPAFGPLHYEKLGPRAWLWVRLNEQVVDHAGKPLDISGTFFYSGDGASPEIILDQSDPSSRPVRRVGSVGHWAVYD
ncbi:MAG: hypothetical protein ACYC63_05880 [Armatimonadota bacterium]